MEGWRYWDSVRDTCRRQEIKKDGEGFVWMERLVLVEDRTKIVGGFRQMYELGYLLYFDRTGNRFHWMLTSASVRLGIPAVYPPTLLPIQPSLLATHHLSYLSLLHTNHLHRSLNRLNESTQHHSSHTRHHPNSHSSIQNHFSAQSYKLTMPLASHRSCFLIIEISLQTAI